MTRPPVSPRDGLDILGQALHHALALVLARPGVDQAVLQVLVAQYLGVLLDSDEVNSPGRGPVGLACPDLLRWDPALRAALLPALPNGQLQNGQVDLALKARFHNRPGCSSEVPDGSAKKAVQKEHHH